MLAGVSGIALTAMAEDLTLSTYYPSPKGVYQELRTNTLEVAGRLQLTSPPVGGRPVCTQETRGTLWFEREAQVGNQFVDRLEFCARIGDVYRWIIVHGTVEE